MKLKKLIFTFLGIYGARALIKDHGDDIVKWLDRKAQEIGRKAGESYAGVNNSVYEFGKAYYADMENGDIYFTKLGNKENFDLLSYEFRSTPVDIHNFEKYDCYILTARGD